ncbi:MAG: branched-chain amino acid ABC transporter permease [Gammaproteobacteria bacterium]
MALFPSRGSLYACLAGIALALAAPLFSDVYILALLMQIGYYGVAAIGLGILVGMSGQISMGHGALFGFGAFASAWLAGKGIPVFFCIPLAGLMTTAAGMIFGVPATRIKGLYLAIATLAAQFILEDFFVRAEWFTGGAYGASADPVSLFGFVLDTDARYYYLVLGWFLLLSLAAANLRRGRCGRALVAVRDHYLSAEMAGIRLNYYRLLAFGLSSFYAGVGGALYAHYLGYVSAEAFTIFLSVQFLAMIVIGGMGSVAGAILGTAFIVLLPETMETLSAAIAAWPPAAVWGVVDALPYFKEMAIGLAIVLFLIFDPDGLHHRWLLIKAYWKYYPFSR